MFNILEVFILIFTLLLLLNNKKLGLKSFSFPLKFRGVLKNWLCGICPFIGSVGFDEKFFKK